ncbi:MAG TPA: glutathione peroxidase [Acidimicrobiales bacterium]|nr:glutathione peroxidase [Acidimicrobiales bacterium]
MTSIADIEYKRMDGDVGRLADYEGDVVLVVNVASKCGLTPQYEGLQNLYEEKHGSGFTVLAFPANNFGGQEPGSDEEIAEFCSTQYSVTFPVASKISVLGSDQHPLYSALTSQITTAAGKDEFRERLSGYGMTPTEDPDVLWNFEKFLVARDGSVVGRFAPTVSPDDPTLVAAIDSELAKG